MKKGRKLALLGACLQLGPLSGLVVSIAAMISGIVKLSDLERGGQAPSLRVSD